MACVACMACHPPCPPNNGVNGVTPHAAAAASDDTCAPPLPLPPAAGAPHLDAALLGAPRLVLHALEQRRQHQLHTLAGQLAHDGAGGAVGGVADLPGMGTGRAGMGELSCGNHGARGHSLLRLLS